MQAGEIMKRMVVVLMLCVFVAAPGLCVAGARSWSSSGGSGGRGSTYGSTVKPDPVSPGQYRTYDSKGNWTGTLKPDPVQPGQYRIEDKNGKPAGFIKPDPLNPGQYRGTPTQLPK
jgi:hypothetical protein